MSETGYNPDDPAFLLSRSLDEELSGDQRERLERALAASESLQAEAEQLRAVDRLVKAWAAKPIELDWDHHAALACAQPESEEDSEDLCKVDRLLDRWGARSAPVDAEEFTAAVLARVRGSRGRRSRRGLIFRLGAPLAAAAAIGVVLTGRSWLAPPAKPVCQVVYESMIATRAAPHDLQAAAGAGERTAPVAVVAFNRTPVASVTEMSGPVGVSLGTIGSAPLVGFAGGSPPL